MPEQKPRQPRKRVQRVTPEGAVVDEDGVQTIRVAPADEIAVGKDLARVDPTSAAAATNMAVAGVPYSRIVEVCGYTSEAQARHVVEEQLAGLYGKKDRAGLFHMVAAQHDALLASLAPTALQPMVPMRSKDTGLIVTDQNGEPIMELNKDHLAYAKAFSDALSRKSKLHGLDAPTEVRINPTAENFNKVLNLLDEARKAGGPIEADIFGDIIEAEIVPDGEL